MRKAGYKKAAALLLVTSLVAGTALTGCGKKKVDYNMGDDENGGGGGKLASRLDVPESYNGKLEGINADTGLTDVSINATEIEVPDTDKMSVLYYELNNVDNDYKKRVCENIFDVSAGVYVYNWDKPYKEDVQREIDSLQAMMDQATSDDDKSYYEDYMKTLKDQLKTASDTREGAGDYSGDTFIGSVGDNEFMVTFYGSGDDMSTGGGFSLEYYPSDQLIQYRPKDGATSVSCYSSEYSDEEASANTASISAADAEQKGTDFLASCGISDVIETSNFDLLWDYSDASYNTVAAEKNGYMVTYKRSVDGVAPYTPNVYGLDSLSTGDDSVYYDTMDETFQLGIDDNGLISAYCLDSFRATGDKKDNVDLISWEDALKKLPEAVNKYYTDNKTQYSTIEFNDVRLTYYKLKDGDKYTYSPVWIFAQCDKMEDGSLDKDYPIQLIMLDATTGDMIDLKDVLNQQTYDSSVVDSVIDSDSDFDISDDSLIDETDITDTDDADSSDESSADAIDIGDADIDMGDQDTTE